MTIVPLRLIDGVDIETLTDSLEHRLENLVGLSVRTGEPRKELGQLDLIPREDTTRWRFVGAAYQLDKPVSWLARSEGESPDSDGLESAQLAELAATYRQLTWHLA